MTTLAPTVSEPDAPKAQADKADAPKKADKAPKGKSDDAPPKGK
jgi:hypothetical protein